MAVLPVLTMWNLWTNPVCVLLMPQYRYTRETPSFIVIPFDSMCCAWVGWGYFFKDLSDLFGRAEDISYRPTVFYLRFSTEHVFPNYFIIFYSSLFTFLANKLFDLWSSHLPYVPPPLANWNIVESGAKPYNPNL